MRLNWQSPDVVPEIPEGTAKEFWIAVHSEHTSKEHVFLAKYQNKPLRLDDDGDPTVDWAVCSPEDEWVDAVGWCHCEEHPEVEQYLLPIVFSHTRLVGWAEYTPPVFSGFDDDSERLELLAIFSGKEIACLAELVGYSVRKRYAELERKEVAVYDGASVCALECVEDGEAMYFKFLAGVVGADEEPLHGIGDELPPPYLRDTAGDQEQLGEEGDPADEAASAEEEQCVE